VFVTERPGRVRLIRDGAVPAQPFLDLTAITLSDDEERGLLSLAFAPDYATSGRFYVYLTAKAPLGEIQIWEFHRSAPDPNVADAADGRLLLSIPHNQASNHNGGQLQIGPDGKLWLATGDGGGSNNQFGHAQNRHRCSGS
jgi:glucose/arabinose dehydrogenase